MDAIFKSKTIGDELNRKLNAIEDAKQTPDGLPIYLKATRVSRANNQLG